MLTHMLCTWNLTTYVSTNKTSSLLFSLSIPHFFVSHLILYLRIWNIFLCFLNLFLALLRISFKFHIYCYEIWAQVLFLPVILYIIKALSCRHLKFIIASLTFWHEFIILFYCTSWLWHTLFYLCSIRCAFALQYYLTCNIYHS